MLLNPHISLTIDEPWPPLRRVVLKGCAQSLKDDPAHMHALTQHLAQLDQGKAAPAGLVNQVQRAFRIQPDSMHGWQGLP
jgi:hypothetical protein